jgi:hypothetical protein
LAKRLPLPDQLTGVALSIKQKRETSDRKIKRTEKWIADVRVPFGLAGRQAFFCPPFFCQCFSCCPQEAPNRRFGQLETTMMHEVPNGRS